MLKIQKQQMAAFERESLLELEERVLLQVIEAYPIHHRILGVSPLRAAVHLGFERAGVHGFRFDRSLRTYVDLMFMVGSGFDDDPQLPWAAAALADRASKDEATRAELLFAAARAYLMRVAGHANDHLLGALARARALPLPAGPTVEEATPPLLQDLMPTKYEELGPAGVSRLLQRGRAAAARYGITGTRGVTLYVVLMFILGAGFDQEPLAPWASTILNDKAIRDEHARADQLHAAALTNLDAWLAC